MEYSRWYWRLLGTPEEGKEAKKERKNGINKKNSTGGWKRPKAHSGGASGEPLRWMPAFTSPQQSAMGETKVIYHLDDQETPYLVKLPIPAERVTLLDLKNALKKPNYKFFFKSMDDDFGWACRTLVFFSLLHVFLGFNAQFQLFPHLLSLFGSWLDCHVFSEAAIMSFICCVGHNCVWKESNELCVCAGFSRGEC